jgi:hypothetical protein
MCAELVRVLCKLENGTTANSWSWMLRTGSFFRVKSVVLKRRKMVFRHVLTVAL